MIKLCVLFELSNVLIRAMFDTCDKCDVVGSALFYVFLEHDMFGKKKVFCTNLYLHSWI